MNVFKNLESTGNVSICNKWTNNLKFNFVISKNPFIKENEGEIIALQNYDSIEIFLDDKASNENIGKISNYISKALQEGKFQLIEGNKLFYLLLSGTGFKEASEEDYNSLKEYLKGEEK